MVKLCFMDNRHTLMAHAFWMPRVDGALCTFQSLLAFLSFCLPCELFLCKLLSIGSCLTRSLPLSLFWVPTCSICDSFTHVPSTIFLMLKSSKTFYKVVLLLKLGGISIDYNQEIITYSFHTDMNFLQWPPEVLNRIDFQSSTEL